MRLFIGIFPPKEILDSFVEIQNGLDQFKNYIRFTKKENIHITVKYLGDDISKDSLNGIIKDVRKVTNKTEAFDIRLKSIRYGFPGRRWPRIMYISIYRSLELNTILSKINDKLNCYNDIHKEKYDLSSMYHFTLARSKKGLTREVILDIRKRIEKIDLWDGFHVNKLGLISSKLDNNGPLYKNIESFSLEEFLNLIYFLLRNIYDKIYSYLFLMVRS